MTLKQMLRVIEGNKNRRAILVKHKGKLFEIADRYLILQCEEGKGDSSKAPLVLTLVDIHKRVDETRNFNLTLN